MNTNAQTALLNIRASLKAQQSFYDALKLDGLPEDIKSGVTALRADLNSQLKKMEPLDQIPLASEAASALNWFVDAMVRMQEYADRMFSNLQTMHTNLSTVTKSYNELQTQVTDGTLVTKEKVVERCELAKKEGVESCAAEIAELRQKITTGLPKLPENIAKLGQKEFASAIETAWANLTKAGEYGLNLEEGNKGKKFLERTVFLGADVFTTELAGLTEFAGVKPGKAATAPAGKPNPNGGGQIGENDEAPEAETTPRRRFRMC